MSGVANEVEPGREPAGTEARARELASQERARAALERQRAFVERAHARADWSERGRQAHELAALTHERAALLHTQAAELHELHAEHEMVRTAGRASRLNYAQAWQAVAVKDGARGNLQNVEDTQSAP
jgi:hypothetical protein